MPKSGVEGGGEGGKQRLRKPHSWKNTETPSVPFFRLAVLIFLPVYVRKWCFFSILLNIRLNYMIDESTPFKLKGWPYMLCNGISLNFEAIFKLSLLCSFFAWSFCLCYFFAIPNYGKPLLAKVLPSEIVDFSYCLFASIGFCMGPMEMDKGSILKHFILKSGNFGGVVYIKDKWDSSLVRLLPLWYVGQMGS